MRKLLGKLTKKRGLAPGTIVYTGKTRKEKPQIQIIDYSEGHFDQRIAKKVEECFSERKPNTVRWINVVGIHETELLESISKGLDMHPLVVEDIANVTQRPKVDDYEEYIFIVVKMIYYHEDEIILEQVSFILFKDILISFQETTDDVFNNVRERIRGGKSKMLKRGADYLAYSLTDAIIDNYFVVLEAIGDKIEEIEKRILENPTQTSANTIHKLKRDLIFIRKGVWPLRDVISNLQRNESKIISRPTGLYLRDLYDHTVQVIDTVETFRDMVSGIFDIYLSSVSNKMNEVMKVLTIIATIFIPLTFIAGVYGMNFEHMPELEWPFGYLFVWCVMLTMAGTMTVYFKKKRWL